MRAVRSKKVTVALAIAGVLVALPLGWWTWRGAAPPPESVAGPTSPAFVQIAGSGAGTSDQVLRERAELFDPTPFFFPTQWNYGEKPERVELQRDPAQVFPSFDPRFVFPEQSVALKDFSALNDGEDLPHALASGNPAPFSGLGVVDAPRTALESRSAYLEVRLFAGGKPVLAKLLNGIVLPKTDFMPLEFLVVVAAEGAVGEPILASSSGFEEVDAFFRTYLLNSFRIGERLSPGRYRVLVGP